MSGLDTALTPLRFLERSLEAHPDREAIVDGPRRFTYRQMAETVQNLAEGLVRRGLQPGDTVAVLAPNSAEALIAHYAVPLAGGVLVMLNTRLAPPEVEYILGHSEVKFFFGDAGLLQPVVDEGAANGVETIVVHPDEDGTPGEVSAADLSVEAYADWTASAPETPRPYEVEDETTTITVNYTSGTTGRPKGVMYSHRGAYLNSLGEVITQGFAPLTRYLWTLPMFHCNGWCTTWALTAVSGTHVCIRAVRGPEAWRLIDEENVTRMAGAPVVLNTIAGAKEAHNMDGALSITTAGAPPSPTTIALLEGLGIEVIHVYGLTESYGPYSSCEPQPEWAGLPVEERAALKSRQGIGMISAERVRVVELRDDDVLTDVPRDGATMGEIILRGNNVMKGYLNAPEDTAAAFRGGWFHTGDLAVMHEDGYVQILDRAKDIVISGGENISTIEVEQALVAHESVAEAAVVGMPDEKWGQRPLAYVVLKPGTEVTEADLIAFVKTRIASYKAPAGIEFVDELPTTSTGKIRKNALREMAGN
ncbi:AMP-binding protein [Brevibacterium epidermidis]|uniref:AMP-binding protein n=1 Tax=Brevibacterium epidermidis TaxID=1698 RepID=UPI0018E42EE1|nr:AMP-binding protein [Brevibacterium epidermidis]